MLNARLTAAHRIADALGISEADIEAAISSTSRLMSAISEGRRDTKVPVTVGQKSLDALGQVVGALVQARGTMIEAHAALAEDKVAAGLRQYGMGDLGDCPPASARLALVDPARSAA